MKYMRAGFCTLLGAIVVALVYAENIPAALFMGFNLAYLSYALVQTEPNPIPKRLLFAEGIAYGAAGGIFVFCFAEGRYVLFVLILAYLSFHVWRR